MESGLELLLVFVFVADIKFHPKVTMMRFNYKLIGAIPSRSDFAPKTDRYFIFRKTIERLSHDTLPPSVYARSN